MFKFEDVQRMLTDLGQKIMKLSGQAPREASLDAYDHIVKSIREVNEHVSHAMFKEYVNGYDFHEPAYNYNEEVYRLKYKSARDLMTPFGKIQIERNIYQNASDTKTVAPVDAALGFQNEYMTLDVRELVSYSLSSVTAEELVGILRKSCYPGCPHPTQMKNAAEEVGTTMREKEQEIRATLASVRTIPDAVKSVVVSMDGVCVRLNEKGEASPGRPAERPHLNEPDAPKSTYKNAMVGSISFYGEVPEGKKTPQRLGASYLAQMPEMNSTTFKKRLLEDVSDVFAQIPKGTERVFLCDGARSIWTFFEGAPLFEGCQAIVDYFHATEHLSLAAEALFGKEGDAAGKWFDKYADILINEDGAVDSLLRSMKHYASVTKLTPLRLKQFNAQNTYFKNNKHRMDYSDYRRRGLPIGSGPIEAACKTIVKQRMCRSGMRWSREGGQNIVDLRAYVKSNQWDTAWGVYRNSKKAA